MSKFVYLYLTKTLKYKDEDGQPLFRAGQVIEAARCPPSPWRWENGKPALDENGRLIKEETKEPGWCSRYNCHFIRQGEAYEPDPTQHGYDDVEAYIEQEYDTDVDLNPFISAMG